ncbi:MAG: signal recognition particle-docking protein FtsY [Pseudomonadota bacterium]
MAKKFFSGLFGGSKESDQDAPQPSPSNAADAAIDDRSEGEADLAPSEEQASKEVQPSPTQPTDSLEDEKPALEPVDEPTKKKGWFGRLADGLSKSSNKLKTDIGAIFVKRKLDDDTLEELTDLLISADLGVAAASRITDALAADKFDKEITDAEVRDALALEVSKTLTPLEKPLAINRSRKPHVMLMVGVNGSGKTTTIGKLARKYADEGLSVMLAAGDTFRAAAIEQLSVWGDRANAPVIARDVGADAAGLAFDAFKEAQAQERDVLIIDTAGRLQNKSALMDELAKIVRVLKKIDDSAPHDVVLVLDATVGQNAISHAEAFSEIAGVTGLVMTKLDGTARVRCRPIWSLQGR